MTSTVIPMTHSVDERVIKKLFAKFSTRYGSLWTARLGENGNWKDCEDDWLEELSRFNFTHLRAAVKKCFTIYIDYPPTLGQLIHLCMKESGVPDEGEVIRLMVNRDFNHPMVKMIYDKIGSWALINGKEHEIQSKVKSYYDSCLADFYSDPEPHWSKLTSFNNQAKLEAPTKIPSQKERKGFKEHMEEFKRLAEEGKAKLKDMTTPDFDPKKIKPEGEQYVDYCKYLLSVPEHLVLGLPPVYAYDRQRLLNRQDTARHLKESGYIPPSERDGFEAPRSANNNKPTRVYKNWAGE